MNDDADKHSDTSNFMKNANVKAELSAKILTKYVIITWFVFIASVSVCNVLYSMLKFGSVDASVLYIPFKLL